MAKTNFIKKWDGKVLEDWGSSVSKEFSTFQNAMKREVNRIAKEIGAELVSFHKGHYDCSWFVKRNGHYVYGSYSVLGVRSMVCLTEETQQGSFLSVYCRTAEHEKDYRGGCNNNCYFEDVQDVMDRLLNEEHRRV